MRSGHRSATRIQFPGPPQCWKTASSTCLMKARYVLTETQWLGRVSQPCHSPAAPSGAYSGDLVLGQPCTLEESPSPFPTHSTWTIPFVVVACEYFPRSTAWTNIKCVASSTSEYADSPGRRSGGATLTQTPRTERLCSDNVKNNRTAAGSTCVLRRFAFTGSSPSASSAPSSTLDSSLAPSYSNVANCDR